MDLRQPFHALVVAVAHRRTVLKRVRTDHGSVGGPMFGGCSVCVSRPATEACSGRNRLFSARLRTLTA